MRKPVCLIVLLAALLAFTPPLQALTIPEEITPQYLEPMGVVLTITHEVLTGGKVKFRVEVTPKSAAMGKIDMSLGIVYASHDGTLFKLTGGVSPYDRNLTFTEKDGKMVCSFTVERKACEDQNFCFILENTVGLSQSIAYARLKTFAAL